MKKITTTISVICFFISAFFSVSAQQQNKLPGMGQSAVTGCLACPGTEWNNPQNITQADAQYATTTMNASGFCFQTVCFYTRGLIASDFGFTIPLTATIKGIRVGVSRKANMATAVKDSLIQLEKSGLPTGAKKKANGFWPLTATVKSYGGPADTWGVNWSPADINDAGFGVFLKAYNTTANSPEASVNYIRIVIYYSNNNSLEKQSVIYNFSGNELQVYPSPATEQIKLKMKTGEGNVSVSIINLQGENVIQLNEQTGSGEWIKDINVSSLPAGNYFIRCLVNDEIRIGDFVKE